MTRERHRRLQEIFEIVVDLPEESRRERLRSECGDDRELLVEVEELLAADDCEDQGVIADVTSGESGSSPYRLIREIGRGGMGIVYLAERADGMFEKRVAMKVLQPRLGQEVELGRRFAAERRILAGLDHPSIASLLDAGTLPDGSPFLVMELVEGQPIDVFCVEGGLSVDERLRLFIGVCGAVQDAHQSLVVHRDLKPSNILVREDGLPKLLDFGIAKLLDPGDAEWTVAQTRTGVQPLTPRYASPEQIQGEPVTTGTDVYALGVVLYELLTGRSPIRAPRGSIGEWARSICEDEPTPPSRAVLEEAPQDSRLRAQELEEVDRRRLSRRLEGDLDHVVAKALRKDPRERYATAADLAADLDRHLQGLPIEARRPTLFYRTGKFVRRHRGGVLLAAAALLTLLFFTVSLVYQLRQTRLERDKAETVTELLVQIFGAAGPSTADAGEPTAREVLEKGLEQVEGGLADQPEVKAALLDAIGRVLNDLGRVDEAIRAHEQALALREAGNGDDPLEVAETMDFLSTALIARGDLERAEVLAREALELTRRELSDGDRRTAARIDSLMQVLAKAGRHDEAAELARQVVEQGLRHLGFASISEAVERADASPEVAGLASALASLAAELRQVGRYEEAESPVQAAILLHGRALGDGHFAIAFDRNNLANLLSNQGREEEALVERARALKLAVPAMGSDHPAVASLRLNRADDLVRVGRFEEAREEAETARRDFERALGAEHVAVGMSSSVLGRALSGLGDPEGALALQKEGLAVQRAADPEHPDVAETWIALGETFAALERLPEAFEAYGEALRIQEGRLGAEHPKTVSCRVELAELLREANRREEAVAQLRRAQSDLGAREDLPRLEGDIDWGLARASPPGSEARAAAERALEAYEAAGAGERAEVVRGWLGSRPVPNEAL